MRFKFLLLLFLGLFISFGSAIKGEENICKYSNYKDYKKCKKKGLSSVPEYPIENFHWSVVAMGPGIRYVNPGAMGNVFQATELKAFSSNHLQVITGSKTVGIFGFTWRRPFINKKTIKINPNKIISLKKREIHSKWREYKIKYIDDFGEVEFLEFQQYLEGRNGTFDIVGDYLIYASNLNWGEEISAESKIEEILKENEKFLTITKSIIFESNNFPNKCFIAKDTKFPELTERYKKLYGTINPLRAKLDLPPSSELEPICRESKGFRPAWMEEKIKGCDKYPTKKQRDYCIDIYSPYGT